MPQIKSQPQKQNSTGLLTFKTTKSFNLRQKMNMGEFLTLTQKTQVVPTPRKKDGSKPGTKSGANAAKPPKIKDNQAQKKTSS